MTNVRTTKVGSTTYYSAKDIFEALDIRWNGNKSLAGLEDKLIGFAGFKTKVGNSITTLSQYGLTKEGVKEVAKKHKKDASIFGFEAAKAKDTTKQIDKMQKTITDMKVVLSKLLTEGNKVKKDLPVQGVSAKVIGSDPLQVQARKQIREIVQDYASKRANDLNITDENRRIFFDLSFKALYNAYKDKTPNKIDLKAIADKETERTGTKVSGLQIAERLGLAIELLKFTKSFYKNIA